MFHLTLPLSLALPAPCPPAHVNASINCQTNSAMVQWHPNGGAESYEVQALGSRGDIAGCNTTGMFCNMSNLLCGDVYNVSVFAISNNCRVTGNLVTQLRTGKIIHTQVYTVNTHIQILTLR